MLLDKSLKIKSALFIGGYFLQHLQLFTIVDKFMKKQCQKN